MGWFQDNIWNNLFKYAYPISFIGTLFFLILSIFQKPINEVISNTYVLIIYYILIGASSIISLLSWIDIDYTNSNDITSYIDLDLNQTKNIIIYKNK